MALADGESRATAALRRQSRSAVPTHAASEARPATGVLRNLPVIPVRYALREKDGQRFLECEEAPRVRAILDPRMAVSRSEAASLGERVILLDGAGSFGPVIDNEKRLYNLDHHDGCERLFTLATCEQALLLVQSGIELTEGDWTIYANDPDLDTVLALWCLLNHRRLRELSPESRDILLPLLRFEGAIDANGSELGMYCGLPQAVIEATQQRIEDLMVRERGLKRTGSWANKNVHAYTLEMLRSIDAMVYNPEEFGDHSRVEEIYGHVEIAPRRVAVACRDRSGIYTVEQHLKSRWGDQLAIVALENEPGVYTLRRISSLSGPTLEPAYERLNRLDPAVDGRPPGKRWGGSRDIGGSPRPQGTRLSAEAVLEILADAYEPASWWKGARRSIGAFAVGLSVLIFWPIAAALLSLAPLSTHPPGVQTAHELALASMLSLLVATLATRIASRRRAWAFGWRSAAKGGGLWLLPVALAGALPVTIWTSGGIQPGLQELAVLLAAGGLCLLAVEVWFRGLVHGMLAVDFPVLRPRGPWGLSRAALVSSLAYAAVAALGIAPAVGVMPSFLESGGFAPFAFGPLALAPYQVAGAAFVVGLALAVIRERSLSLLPGLEVQLAGMLLASLGLYALR